MDPVQIVEIKAASIDEYKAFFSAGLLHDEDSFRISINDDINAPFPTKDSLDSFTLGAYLHDVLVGVVSFERDGVNREKLRHKGILFRMYVSTTARGKGIAKKLVEELLLRVKAIGSIEQINLTVIADNDKAKHLYESFGFKTFSHEEKAIKWKGNYFTEDQMVLRIQ